MPLHDDFDRPLRQQQLLELLRHLAARIHAIDGVEGLRLASAELDRLLDTARTTLVHLDDPSPGFLSAEHQRIVDEARQASTSFDQPGEDLPWRRPQAE